MVGQSCGSCGFRVSAQRPFASLGGSAGSSSADPAGPPESLFPPISRPERPFSAWSKPEPGGEVKTETPQDPGVVELLESRL